MNSINPLKIVILFRPLEELLSADAITKLQKKFQIDYLHNPDYYSAKYDKDKKIISYVEQIGDDTYIYPTITFVDYLQQRLSKIKFELQSRYAKLLLDASTESQAFEYMETFKLNAIKVISTVNNTPSIDEYKSIFIELLNQLIGINFKLENEATDHKSSHFENRSNDSSAQFESNKTNQYNFVSDFFNNNAVLSTLLDSMIGARYIDKYPPTLFRKVFSSKAITIPIEPKIKWLKSIGELKYLLDGLSTKKMIDDVQANNYKIAVYCFTHDGVPIESWIKLGKGQKPTVEKKLKEIDNIIANACDQFSKPSRK